MTTSMKSLSVRVSDQLDRRIAGEAMRKGISKNALVREALSAHLPDSTNHSRMDSAQAKPLDALMDRICEAIELWCEEGGRTAQLHFVGVQRVSVSV